MRKIIFMMGLAGILYLQSGCKKEKLTPEDQTTAKIHQVDSMGLLYVQLNSKRCADTPDGLAPYSAVYVDFDSLKVFNTLHGWETLDVIAGAWDVKSLQMAPVAVAELTEKTPVHGGNITKLAIYLGDNNSIVPFDVRECFRLSTREVILNLDADINLGMLSKIVVSIDICGNISLHMGYDQIPCYTLKVDMAIESFSSTAINQ